MVPSGKESCEANSLFHAFTPHVVLEDSACLHIYNAVRRAQDACRCRAPPPPGQRGAARAQKVHRVCMHMHRAPTELSHCELGHMLTTLWIAVDPIHISTFDD
jgi:hypothetical protein